VEEELRVEGVPYRLLGGTQFFDRKEVKDALSYLRVVLYPYDELALRRVINHPPRGIGAKTVERLTRYAEAHETPLGVAFKKLPTMDDVPNLARQGARRLQAALEDSRSRLKGGERLVTLCQKLVSDVGLERDIRSEGGIVAKRKWDNMEFLFNSLRRYEKSQGSDANLAEFLNRTMLRVEQEEEAASNRVTLSTLHASKGLEFPCVYLIGCVEGYLPHRRTTEPKLTEAAPSDVEEERRLFYVGVTRARDELYLTRARKRRERGKEAPLAPSRFLEGLPEHAVEHLEPEVEPTMDKDELAQAASDILAMLSGG
jgi:DNA helicase-2/ATP-dependent DNA helicase PcrA